MQLKILSGGAAQGLVHALSPQFQAQTGCEIEGIFGAVGAMRDKLLDEMLGDKGERSQRTRLGQAMARSVEDRKSVV